jgi:hypothetical protein
MASSPRRHALQPNPRQTRPVGRTCSQDEATDTVLGRAVGDPSG